ncbi:MAG: outer membrane beta-barrel protein [Prevotella sp.]|nr:outer membrane beta-barrel protein [Prevotella sp.]
MKRSLLLTILFFLIPLSMLAQNRLVTGEITDRDTHEPMMQTTVQLLKTDSTFVTGAITNDKGLFSIAAPSNGRYLLRLSNVGYATTVKRIEIVNDKNLAMGKVVMGADAVMLKGATVTAQAQKVTLKEDTFVYNSAAFRTPEGSTIEELVKRLPGAQVDDNGKITINGKEVKKIMVDGKEFMTGDTKTALKNLPTSIVDRIKAYDEKSDLSRVTGIDDGEEQTVLDFGLKRGMNKGMFSNIDLGIGTKDRYAERVMAAMFNSKSRFMIFGSANNVNDQGFGRGGGRFGGGMQGLNATKMLGMNYNFEEKKKLKVDASVRWNHANGDRSTVSSSENFVSTVGSFSNSKSQNYTRSNSWDARGRLEWTPDTMTNIMFRPSFTYSTNDSRSMSTTASYNQDPYLYVVDPLAAASIAQLAEDSLMVNSRENMGLSYSDNKSVQGMLQYNRRLGNRGRNFTIQLNANYGKSDSKSLSLSDVVLYQLKTAMGLDSTYQTNRWNLTPTKNWGYRIRTTYSEPLWRGAFLQFSYQFNFSSRRSDRSTYDFSHITSGLFDGVPLVYRGWDSYLSLLGNPIESYVDDDLSRFSEYRNYTHELELMFRLIRPKYNLNVGVMVQPQKSDFKQNYQGVHVDTTRTVTNVTPTLDFRYRFSKVSNLRINYRGSTDQPSMTDLLDITDDSNPLDISKGNPGLKPSFTNNFRLFYNTYFEKRQRAIMTFLNYSTTSNSISNKVTYNEVTGGRVTQPENINGNWNAQGGFMFNTAVDTAGYWNVNTFTNLNYNNYVGYLSLDKKSDSQKNTTRSLGLGERLGASYRNSWLEVELDGSLNYTHSRNELQSQSDLDTWQFSYGLNVNLTAPWGTSLSTDIHENSRRGYNDNSMNTNELVWNAQVSQSFLKGRPLTVSLQFYDILHNQSNFSRTLSAIQRNDVSYNSITSYAMLHVIYKLNIFGSKEARAQMFQGRGERGFGGPRDGFRGRRGPRGGGFGGPRHF